MQKKFSLILGGGAARGLAHIGVLRRMEELGITPACIVGTSIGAIIGALAACEYGSHDMEGIASDINIFNLLDIDFQKWGIKGKKIMKFLEKYIGTRSFSDTIVPLKIIATDINTGEKIVFSEGKILDAIRASISIPGLFSSYKHHDRELVDGGVVANLAIEESLPGYPAIGVSILADESRRIEKSLKKFFDIEPIQSTYRILRKTVHIMMMQNEERSIESLPDALIIRIGRSDIDYYDFHRVSELIAEGYLASAPLSAYLQKHGSK